MSTSYHTDVGKRIDNHIKETKSVVLNLRVLRDKMTPLSQIPGPEFGSPGLFEFLSGSELVRSADDLASAVTEIRKQTVSLANVLSTVQKENIEKLMEKVNEEEKELALVETPLRRKVRAYENRAFHYTDLN